MLDVQRAIKKLREAGITQRELADAIGVSQQTVSVWEREGLPERFAVPIRAVEVLEERLESLGEADTLPPQEAE